MQAETLFPCVDGALLARGVLTLMQRSRAQPCVRPVDAAHVAAGPNAVQNGPRDDARKPGGSRTASSGGFPLSLPGIAGH